MKEILILPILPLCDPAYLVLFSWQVIYRTIALINPRTFQLDSSLNVRRFLLEIKVKTK